MIRLVFGPWFQSDLGCALMVVFNNERFLGVDTDDVVLD
jgi:hypothetical protein